MKPVRISGRALLGVHVSGLLTAMVLFGCGVAALSLEDPDLAIPGGWMMFAGLLTPVATCALVMAVLIHRMWKALQFAGARPTPGKAVGLCFVPGFNLYWFFPAIAGWAREHNRILRERRLGLPPMSEGLALVVTILLELCLVPYCQAIPMLALGLALIPILVLQVSGHINALADAVERGLPEKREVPAAAPPEVAPAQPPPPAVAPPIPPGAATAPPIPGAAATRLSALAVVSLIVSALGFCTGGLGGLVGMPLGLVALLRIRNPKNRLHGNGLAIAGMAVGAVALILGLLVAAMVGAAAFAQRPAHRVPQAPAAPASRPVSEPAPAEEPE